MLELRGYDSALSTQSVTGRGVGRVTNVTCQALPSPRVVSGREGRGFHGAAEVLWERASCELWGLGQPLPAAV